MEHMGHMEHRNQTEHRSLTCAGPMTTAGEPEFMRPTIPNLHGEPGPNLHAARCTTLSKIVGRINPASLGLSSSSPVR